MSSEAIDDLGRALRITGEVVASIREPEWGLQTPCTEWDVLALTSHLVGGNRNFAALLRGDQPTGWTAAGGRTGLVAIVGDPASAYAESADQLLSAFGSPAALERTISLPIGAVPGRVALGLRLTEALVHGWDLAVAVNRPVLFPDSLVEQAFAFTQAQLATIPADRRPFAPPQPAPDGAAAIDRLAALLGRRV